MEVDDCEREQKTSIVVMKMKISYNRMEFCTFSEQI